VKAIRDSIEIMRTADEFVTAQTGQSEEEHTVRQTLSDLEEEMLICARTLQYERAALLRDQIEDLKQQYHIAGGAAQQPAPRKGRTARTRR